MTSALARGLRLLAFVLVSALALQLYFAARVGLMRWIDPVSTTFQRSETWRLFGAPGGLAWHQQWVAYLRISTSLKRAVIASEDSGFVAHDGVEWDALEKARERNQKTEARAEQVHAAREKQPARTASTKTPVNAQPRIVGGSTITQQLAKNLFLDGERSLVRKGQELAITFMLEGMLSKQRILEIYLNSVEWGEGVFGAEAAAERYFRVTASGLGTAQAAQLAVMLPAPKRFEKRPGSAYVVGRAETVAARMPAVDLP